MDMDLDRKIATTSVVIYSLISVAASLLFFVAATLSGKYNEVARIGGAAWVLLLALIITMPLVTAIVKKQLKA
jgi:hypothetical protein